MNTLTVAPARQAIVDALNTVPGVTAYPVQPASVVAGCAWPALAAGEPVNTYAWLLRYHVYVALPAATPAATVEAGDGIAQQVADVLWPLGRIAIYETWELPVEPGGQPVPALRYTLEV